MRYVRVYKKRQYILYIKYIYLYKESILYTKLTAVLIFNVM